MDRYFMLTGAGGYPAPAGFIDGTIGYAGGSGPPVGSNIEISHLVETLAVATDRELVCDNCVLTFSTGPFAGPFPTRPDGDSFSGGGRYRLLEAPNLGMDVSLSHRTRSCGCSGRPHY